MARLSRYSDHAFGYSYNMTYDKSLIVIEDVFNVVLQLFKI